SERETYRIRPHASPTPDTTQDVDQQAQAVATIPSMFPIRAERQERSSSHDVVRVCSHRTPIVDAPTSRNSTSFAKSHFNLPQSDRTGRHVDHDRRFFFSGKTDGDGICTKHRLCSP